MNKQTEALKMAIEFMETLTIDVGIKTWNEKHRKEAIKACKEALEQQTGKNIRDSFNEMLEDKVAYYKGKQPAQEPVAKGFIRSLVSIDKNGIETWKEEPFYTSAPSWQGLSDDEILKFVSTIEEIKPQHGMMLSNEWNILDFARAIEQALKEKNI